MRSRSEEHRERRGEKAGNDHAGAESCESLLRVRRRERRRHEADFVQDNEKRRIVGRFVLGERYQGGGGMGHGGIIATLLDEAMGKVCRFREVRAVTAELTVQYLKPVSVQDEIIVEGWEDAERKGRNLFHVGEVRNSAGDVLARGKGRFVIIGEAKRV